MGLSGQFALAEAWEAFRDGSFAIGTGRWTTATER